MANILIVCMGYPPVAGGVETYSEEVARSYLRRGFSVFVVTKTQGSLGWRTISYLEGDIRLYNTGQVSQAVAFSKMLFQVGSLILKKPFAMVHATTWRPALAALLFTRRTPLVLTVHGREVLNFPFFLKRPMVEVLRRADVVITVSAATMEIAEKALHGFAPYGKWLVAFNGITYPEEARAQESFNELGPSKVRLLSLSRLVPRKNIQGCIAALSELKSEGIFDFEYWIGGRGPMLEEIKKTVFSANLQENIKFLGYVEDDKVPELYKWAEIFLHPQTHVGQGNDFEGFGLVIADAMSFGCAVIAGEAGGPKEFVKDEVCGLVVDGLDSSSVKNAIRRLIIDKKFRQELGLNAREFSLANLSWDRHVDKILDCLDLKINTSKIGRGWDDR